MNVAEMVRTMATWDVKSEQEIFDKISEHFPDATMGEIAAAMEALASDIEERGRRLKAEGEALMELGEYVADAPGETIGEKLRYMAARGDRKAQAYLDSFNSREHRVQNALMDAAVEKHPDWRKNDRGWRYIGKGKLGDDPCTDLIDWFQRTYPLDAREIERSIA